MTRYAVLGAGRQGTAAVWDLVALGGAEHVDLADASEGAARRSAARVAALTGRDVVTPHGLDAADRDAVRGFLEPADAAISAVPYGLNLGVTNAAIAAGTHICDLGGNTDIVRKQLALDADAREAGVCVVPDCGEAPGLATNLTAYALTLIDDPQDVTLYDGGLPQRPVPPWNYELTFSVDGLTNEYDGMTTWVQGGEPVDVDCLDPDRYERIEMPTYGTLEAFPGNTSSTMPWTLGLRTLRAMILRYPGHHAQFRAFRDLGLFGGEPIDVRGTPVAPRDLYHALLDPRIRATEDARDVVLARVIARGPTQEAVVDLEVLPDDDTGFNAMERSTGGHAAIVCRFMADGHVEPGARSLELAVDPVAMVAEARRRGFRVTEEVRPLP